MSKSISPEIHVVMDSNALFTGRADKLIQRDLSDYIKQDHKSAGLNVVWKLPLVVKAERRMQMLEVGLKFLATVEKLEALLGHKLNINAEGLGDRIDVVIKREVAEHGLVELPCDYGKVDWQSLVNRAVGKQAPFEIETDKGIKDAVILECYSQVVAECGKSARVVLLTNDTRLREAAEERFKNVSNARIIPNLGELKTLLNSVASRIDQNAVEELLRKASSLFYEKDRSTSAFYKLAIEQKIKAHSEYKIPEAGRMISITFEVGQTSFDSKSGRRVTFSTLIMVRFERALAEREELWGEEFGAHMGGIVDDDARVYKIVEAVGRAGGGGVTGRSGGGRGGGGTWRSEETPREGTARREQIGYQPFSVMWQASMMSNGKLQRPRLVEIQGSPIEWKRPRITVYLSRS